MTTFPPILIDARVQLICSKNSIWDGREYYFSYQDTKYAKLDFPSMWSFEAKLTSAKGTFILNKDTFASEYSVYDEASNEEIALFEFEGMSQNKGTLRQRYKDTLLHLESESIWGHKWVWKDEADRVLLQISQGMSWQNLNYQWEITLTENCTEDTDVALLSALSVYILIVRYARGA